MSYAKLGYYCTIIRSQIKIVGDKREHSAVYLLVASAILVTLVLAVVGG